MGSGQSTPRRLTVRNDEPRIIQVSEDVIRRLSSARTADENLQKKPSASVSTETNFIAPAPTITTPAPTITSAPTIRGPTKAEVLAAEQLFKQELDKIEKMAPKKKENQCQNISAKVAECYSNHPTQTLRCSESVREFAQCAYRIATVS